MRLVAELLDYTVIIHSDLRLIYLLESVRHNLVVFLVLGQDGLLRLMSRSNLIYLFIRL